MGLAEQTLSRVGTLTEEAVENAGEITGRIPEKLREAVREPFSARAIVYALLLDRDEQVRSSQLTTLTDHSPEQDAAETRSFARPILELPDELRLPLLDLAIPSLRQMSKNQYDLFREMVQRLIEADGKLSLFEYATSSLLKHYLDAAFEQARRPMARYSDIRYVLPAVRVILSRAAYEGAENDPSTAASAFDVGMKAALGTDGPVTILPEAECELDAFDASLKKLRGANLKVKQQIIRGVAECVLADQQVTVRENELLRVICANLDCPLPPLPVFARPF
jgi:hypothetical protein